MKVSPAIMGPKILSEPAKKKHSLLFGNLVTIWSYLGAIGILGVGLLALFWSRNLGNSSVELTQYI